MCVLFVHMSTLVMLDALKLSWLKAAGICRPCHHLCVECLSALGPWVHSPHLVHGARFWRSLLFCDSHGVGSCALTALAWWQEHRMQTWRLNDIECSLCQGYGKSFLEVAMAVAVAVLLEVEDLFLEDLLDREEWLMCCLLYTSPSPRD